MDSCNCNHNNYTTQKWLFVIFGLFIAATPFFSKLYEEMTYTKNWYTLAISGPISDGRDISFKNQLCTKDWAYLERFQVQLVQNVDDKVIDTRIYPVNSNQGTCNTFDISFPLRELQGNSFEIYGTVLMKNTIVSKDREDLIIPYDFMVKKDEHK
jgi:hypothetical protein